MESQGGWIKLYWKLKNNPIATNLEAMGLWVHILLSVSKRRTLLPTGAWLEPGQVTFSVEKLAEHFNISRKRLDKYLAVFEAEGMIRERNATRRGTIFTVSNWNSYQSEGTQTETIGNETGTKRERNDRLTEIPEIPESPKKERARARPTFEQAQQYASEKSYAWDVEEFIDHYEANGWVQGRGKPIKDWKAAMRNWNKREREFGGKGKNGKPCHEGPMTTEEGYTFGTRDGIRCFFSRQLNMWVDDEGEPTKCQSYSIPDAPTDLPSMRANAATAEGR